MIPGYRIIRELGRGGMATVYLAEQLSLGREVALKVLNPALAADGDFAARFLHEARITGAFRHRHLLAVLDAGRSGEYLYLAMEYVPGGSAAALRGGDPASIRRCLIEVAGALAYAHERGIVHRDIKPDNILIREDGSFLLSDFGVARSAHATRVLTAPQSAIGTPGYMSPEQWRGAAIDGRADLYSLGIVAYELLTGRLPFTGADGWSTGMQHINAPRPLLPPALADWQPVLDHLLAVDPAARYADAKALAAALGGPAATDAPVSNPTQVLAPVPPVASAPSGSGRWRWIAVPLLVAAILLGWWAWTQRPEPVVAPSPGAPATTAAASVDRRPSVAVLPFRALSRQADDEYFADGLSEEILSSLASVPELRVAGRTSAFAWKGKDADLRVIAQSLGVAHVLEGSVRRAGDQLRITARLIQADDGSTRWSRTFERALKDSFAIQNEIALAVADQLSVSIGAGPPPTLARLPDQDRARYLEAVGRSRGYRGDQLRAARATLEELIATRNVGADAYQRLVIVLAGLMRRNEIDFALGLAQQQQLSSQLAERFPESVETIMVSAVLEQSRGDFNQRLEHYRAALRLHEAVMQRAPNEAAAAVYAAHAARNLFEFDKAEAYAERAIAIEPRDPTTQFARIVAIAEGGRVQVALEGMIRLAEEHPESEVSEALPIWLVAGGRVAEALQRTHGCDGKRYSLRDCRHFRHHALMAIGFKRAAAEELRQLRAVLPDEAGAIARTEATYAGRIMAPPAGPADAALAHGAALESLAQGDQAMYLRWIEAAGARAWLMDATDPSELRRAASRTAVLAVQSERLRAEQPRLLAERFSAAAKALATVPDRHFPDLGAVAMVAALLAGDTEAGMRRLQALATISPFCWQDWVVSPSGRDLPIAKVLRADPRFAAIWARRNETIERERRRVRLFWPDVE